MAPKNPENLFKRGRVWYIDYWENGARVVRSLRTTKLREAERLRDVELGKRGAIDLLEKHLGIQTAGETAGPAPMFAQVAARFLVACEAGDLSPKTVRAYRGAITNWMNPAFGNRPVNTITIDTVESWVAHLRRSRGRTGRGKLGRETIASYFRLLRQILRWARKRGIYEGNDPCDIEKERRPARARQTRKGSLKAEQCAALLPHLGGWLHRLVWLIGDTGMRIGEACGLAWDDFDLNADPPTYTLCRTYQDGELKTGTSAETTVLKPDFAATLRRWKLESDSPWVFPSKYGKPRRSFGHRDRKRLHEAAERAGIALRLTPHTMRRTAGTLLYDQTKDVRATQSYLRHADVSTTMGVYVQGNAERDAEALAQLPSIGPRDQHLRSVK